MLHLPDVTLVVVDTLNHALAARAIGISQSACRFAETLFFSDQPAPGLGDGCVHVPIGALDGVEAYSRVVMQGLLPHVRTSHALISQWDGYVINPAAWDPAFLDYDYIGAPWGFFKEGPQVGNGGFSLRSRKLLQALREMDIPQPHPEDVVICRELAERLERDYGIRFAPVEVARRFSFESEMPDPDHLPFGFHGVDSLRFTVSAAELQALVSRLPAGFAGSAAFWLMVRRLVVMGHGDEACHYLQARLEQCPADAESRVVLMALQAEGCSPMPGETVNAFIDRNFRSGMSLHQQGRLDEALLAFGRVLVAGGLAHGLHVVAVIMTQQRRWAEAEHAARESIQRVPGPVPAAFHNTQGVALRGLQRLDEAAQAFRQAVGITPGLRQAWLNLVLTLEKLGRTAEAIRSLRQALAALPDLQEAGPLLARLQKAQRARGR